MPTGNCLLHQQTVLPVEMPKCLEKKEKKKNTSMRPIPTTPGDTGQRCFPSGPSLGRTRALGATSMCFP